MSMLRTLLSLAAIAMLIDLAVATNFTVGGPTGGWDTSTNLQSWASSQTFLVGDNLVFQYTPNHDVLEVSKADYDSCQASNPILMFAGGTTIIPLASTGKRYFICGTSGHCIQGMKVEVDTLAASAPPPASPPPATPSTPPPATPPTPPPAAPPTPPPAPPTPPPVSPITPPDSSPPPETAAPSTDSPTPTPTMSPLSPSEQPVSSPTPHPSVPTTESPGNSPPPASDTSPPPPSSAPKFQKVAGTTIGFGVAMMMLLNL
ncbi:hypothetical protein RJ639_006049 [Escallonia herrerae]|uniref:Phytocyanin domain-containing protein n=1 Tax=Escallonia herrerae TaxID=1293975 RepID=A0AA88VTP0_9ASTE|nr:hypothetical protein RJ639_006049 [Escallonia herrerae]